MLSICVVLAFSGMAAGNDFDEWLAAKKGRIWTSADGRQINAVLVSYDWSVKTVRIRKQDGHQFTMALGNLSQKDYEFIKGLATVPQLISTAEMKERILSYQLRDVNGNISAYGGKSGRLLEEFKTTVRAGRYDLDIQIDSLEWNAAEYRRVGDFQNADATDNRLTELTILKEQRDLQRRQTEAAEATAEAAQETAYQLQAIKRELWLYRVGW